MLYIINLYILLNFPIFHRISQHLINSQVIVSGENILGELRKPFKCLHSRPYLFTYLAALVFFALVALAITAYYFVLVDIQFCRVLLYC